MKKMLQILRYQLKNVREMVVIGLFCILATNIITDLVFYLTERYAHQAYDHHTYVLTSPIDFTGAVSALLIGLLLFILQFKVALANGISRKTFLLSDLLAAVIAAATLAIFNLALVAGLSLARFWPIMMAISLFYPRTGWAGLLLLQFSIYFLLIVAGWFITLAYYRSNKPVKWIISLAPAGLYGLSLVVNANDDGALYVAIHDFLQVNLGLDPAMLRPNPYRAVTSLLACAFILYGLVYLLIRRAPLKN